MAVVNGRCVKYAVTFEVTEKKSVRKGQAPSANISCLVPHHLRFLHV
jgi:hypothetical protein